MALHKKNTGLRVVGILIAVSFVVLVSRFSLGFYRDLNTAENHVRPSLALTAFVEGSISDQDAEEWEKQARVRDPGIGSIQFISKQQAYQTIAQDPEIAKGLMLLKENPLPASFVIHFPDSIWMARSSPGVFLQGMPHLAEMRWDPLAQQMFRDLETLRLKWIQLIKIVCWGIGLCAVYGFFQWKTHS